MILEAKVRDGCKPVVTLDEHAKTSEVVDATLNLIHAIFDRLEKQEENSGLFYLVGLAAKLQNSTDAW